jgi:DNA-binding NarL/FixJ family response regulator
MFIYLSGSDYFKEKKKLILLSKESPENNLRSEFSFLNVNLSRKELIAELDVICTGIRADQAEENGKDLTEREREVLELVAKGYISKDIAAKLNISLYTVQAHRKNISGKLGIKSVSALTVYAMMNGIVNY